MALRYDVQSFEADKFARTPQGGIIIPAAIARTGVLEYELPDGSTRRELRLPEDVFAEDSLASFRGAIVTNRHPDEEISPENFNKLRIGNADGAPRADKEAGLVFADLAIDDPEAVRAVEAGELVEVSAGYRVDLEEKSGVFEGEPFTHIQRGIRGNHIAIGPADWGRSGPEVSLRTDSGSASEKPKTIMHKIKIDGVSFDFGSEAHISKLENDASKRSDEGETIEDLKKLIDELRGELDALKGDEEKTDEEEVVEEKVLDEEKPDEEKSDEDEPEKEKTDEDEPEEEKSDEEEEEMKTDAFSKAVQIRTALEKRAAKILGDEVKFDGKSDRDVMIEAIQKLDSEFDADKRSDDYVSGIFDALKPSGRGMGDLLKEDGGDIAPPRDLNEARSRRDERAANAWKGA